MTIFALFFIEKMSRATWSEKSNYSTVTKQTTQMDREVSANSFDFMMIDTEFEFRQFTHNIPRESPYSLNSDRTSMVTSTRDSFPVSSFGSHGDFLEV